MAESIFLCAAALERNGALWEFPGYEVEMELCYRNLFYAPEDLQNRMDGQHCISHTAFIVLFPHVRALSGLN